MFVCVCVYVFLCVCLCFSIDTNLLLLNNWKYTVVSVTYVIYGGNLLKYSTAIFYRIFMTSEVNILSFLVDPYIGRRK